MSRRSKSNKFLLSSWNLPNEITEYYKRQGVEQMFPWQVQCLQTGKALQGGNLLYSAPTSAGKTLVAEILALKRILTTKKKAIFILPFISVAREKMFSLRAMYSGLGLTVGGFMGAQSPAGGFKRVDIAVCTIERANSLINRLLESDQLSQLAVIVVDELHMVGDSSRGCLIEPLLTKVNFHVDTAAKTNPEEDTSVQIIGMSATLPNMHVLSRWLKADLYCTDFRPVPLTEYVKIGASILNNQLEYVRNVKVPGSYEGDSELIVNLCLETIKEGKSVLIFCPTKNWCEKLCNTIAKSFYKIMAGKEETSNTLSDPVTKAIDKQKILEVLDQLSRTPAGLAEQIKLSISYATAYHHAGLTMEEKDIIESAFRKSVIRVLISTTTLSSGVNLPAQRVIIRSPIFLRQLIDPLTYKQMVGRAGRKGIDTFGESILICKPTEKKLVQSLLNSDLPPARSQLIRIDEDGNYILKPSVKRALLEMIASGSAKTVEKLNKYVRCTLLAAELESAGSGNVTRLVDDCLCSLHSDEFINITKSEAGDADLLTPTQLGSAVFASSMNPNDSLTILSDLNKARKQFVLENELHMVYQVTPISALSDSIDWMRFLNLWESLPIDQQRVGELVGVSERFITLSHQGKRRRNNDNHQRSLQIHRRFYTALVLHDLVNEMSLTTVEKKYSVQKGALQSLQQNAAIFAGMICTFCDRLGWIPLKLLLSDFQQRLDLGVRRELVDLIRIASLDAKKARHFYDSGLRTVSEVVNTGVDEISRLLQTFLPFESSKQGFGETEWELKERTARRVFISSRKSLTIGEAAQLIMDEAQEVFQQDLHQLGVHSDLRNNKSLHRFSLMSTPTVTPIKNNTVDNTTTEVPTTGSVVDVLRNPPAVTPILSPVVPEAKQDTTPSTSSNRSIFGFTRLKEPSPSGEDVLIADSQEQDNQSKYTELLNHIEECTGMLENRAFRDSAEIQPVMDGQIEHVRKHGSKKDGDNSSQLLVGNGENRSNESSMMWEDSFSIPSQASKGLVTPERPDDQFSRSPNLLDALLENKSEKRSPLKGQTAKRVLLSPDMTYTRLKKPRRIRTSTVDRSKSLSQSSQTNYRLSGAEKSVTSPLFNESPISESKKLHENNLIKILESNTLTPANVCQVTPDRSKMTGKPTHGKIDSVTPPIPDMSTTWSIGNSSFLFSAEKCPANTNMAEKNVTSGSADLFSKSMDSVIWSPLSELNHTTPVSSKLRTVKDNQPLPPVSPCRQLLPSTSQPPVSPCHQPLLSMSQPPVSPCHRPLPSTYQAPVSPSRQPLPSTSQPPVSPCRPESRPTIPASPKIRCSDRMVIVDVCSHPKLFDTFLAEWTEAIVYSLSLACSSVAHCEETIRNVQESIGYHSSAESTGSRDSRSSELSTSTIVLSEGILLHQYNVMVVGVAVCINSNTVFYIDLRSQQDLQAASSVDCAVAKKLEHISKILRSKTSTKVIFDSKEHSKRLSSLLGSLELSAVLDPKMAVWMLDPAEKEHNLMGVIHKTVPWLSNVVTTNIGACIGNGSVGLNPHPGTSARLRSCYESLSMMAMMKPLRTLLVEHGLENSFTTIEMPHLARLAKMETDGFGFDVAEFNAQTSQILECLNLIEKKAVSYSKRPFDLGSPKDIGEILFAELHLPYVRKKIVGRKGAPWSTAQTQLEKIKSLHPLPGLILLWRKLHSALKSLVYPLERCKVWCEERSMHRIYSTCSIHTLTGRITMHEPNLQTIRKDISMQCEGFPEISDKLISLRNVFTAPKGYRLLSADYSQLELRMIAHLGADPTLLSLLNAGGDVFKDIASRWKSVPVNEVTDEQRQHAKQICYGIIYGMGSKALSEQLLVEENVAEQLMNGFLSTFIGLKKYIISVIESCRTLGYVTTIAGRKRYLPLINSTTNRAGRSQAERQAVNTTVQGSAADLVKLATINLHNAIHKDVRLVLQMHDELIYEVPSSLLKPTAQLVEKTMQSVANQMQLKVSMLVRVKAGQTWAQLQEIETK